MNEMCFDYIFFFLLEIFLTPSPHVNICFAFDIAATTNHDILATLLTKIGSYIVKFQLKVHLPNSI
jgi:hypothetical protein